MILIAARVYLVMFGLVCSGEGRADPAQRPANLDSRIPWMEDITQPQSGGPNPLLPQAEAILPPDFRFASSAISVTDDGYFAISSWGRLAVLGLDGSIRCNVQVQKGKHFERILQGDSGELILVERPIVDQPVEVVSVDYRGQVRRRAHLQGDPDASLGRVTYDDGEVIFEDQGSLNRRGGRVRPARGSKRTAEKVLPSDLRIDISSGELTLTTELSRQHARTGRPDPVANRMEERKSRTRRFQRKLKGVGLPFLGEIGVGVDAELGARYLSPEEILRLEPDGGLVARMTIRNPLRLSYDEWVDPNPWLERDQKEKERQVLVWFDRSGSIESFLIVPPGSRWAISRTTACLLSLAENRPVVQFWARKKK